MTIPPHFTSPFPVGCLKDLTCHTPTHSLDCIVKISSTTQFQPVRKFTKEKSSIPSPSSFPLTRHRPPTSSQSVMGGLNTPFLIFPMNCKIPVAFSSLNNSDIFLFLRCFHPSSLPMIVHSTLISVFHLPHSLKRWSLVCRLLVSHHQPSVRVGFLQFVFEEGGGQRVPSQQLVVP